MHGRDLRKARPHRDALGPEFLAAPGTDDHIGLPLDHLRHHHDTVLGRALISTIGEDVDAAGDLAIGERHPQKGQPVQLCTSLAIEPTPTPLGPPLTRESSM